MWLVDLCESIAGMSNDAKTVLVLLTMLFLVILGVIINLADKVIDKIGKKGDQDD